MFVIYQIFTILLGGIMAKILITGGSGRIGSGILARLNKIFSADDEIFLLRHNSPPFGAYRGEFKTIEIIKKIEGSFDFTLHLGAQADTNFCKKPENREAVLDANVRLTEIVCQNSAFVLLVSTDNVFDGNSQNEYCEYDEPKPCNFYGESKILAEKIVIGSRGAVVRISTMLGVKNRIVDDGAVRYVQGHDHFPFWNNTFVRPSWLLDLVTITQKIHEERRIGIFHCSCAGRALSRAEMAKFVLKFFQDHHLPTTRESIPEEECPPTFPHRLILSTKWTHAALGLEFTDSEKALHDHLSTKFR